MCPVNYPAGRLNTIIALSFRSVKELVAIYHFAFAYFKQYYQVQIELMPHLAHCIKPVARKEYVNPVRS